MYRSLDIQATYPEMFTKQIMRFNILIMKIQNENPPPPWENAGLKGYIKHCTLVPKGHKILPYTPKT